MSVRDILLQGSTHPDPTPDWAIECAARLAAELGAKASLGICQVYLPPVSNWLANKLMNIDDVISGENRKSAANAEAIIERFKALVPADLLGETTVIECPAVTTPWQIAIRARSHDFSIVPFFGHAETVSVAEGLVFESGRPVLLLPEADVSRLAFGRIAVAWDGSRLAARALADAMPLCRKARSVAIVRVTGEKDLSSAGTASDIVRHLALHGIDAEPYDIALEGRDVAATLQSFCERDGRELLVMGAYGQSRAREFILGGVTRSILGGPRLPILISH